MNNPELARDDEDWLVDDESAEQEAAPAAKRPWKVLIVDDERDVHAATRLAIKDIRYKERPLMLLSAYSAAEGFDLMREHADVALVLLDVVMEADDAGLALVERIRGELRNTSTRIVLRTGQPGQAPEQKVILEYDINDYKTKTELTVQKLFTTVISSLRAYENLLSIEKNRQGLGKILEGAADLFQIYSLKEFASGVLKQISVLLDVGIDGMLCVQRQGSSELEVLAGSGIYESMDGEVRSNPALADAIQLAFRQRRSLYHHPYEVLYISSRNDREFVVHFNPPWPLDDIERNLLELFCQRISAAYDNLHLYQQLRVSQEATVVALADLAEYRDQDTGEHVLRVQKLTDAIARELTAMSLYPDQLSREVMDMIGMAAILHDVGKVGTPDNILFKPGRLDPDERVIMEQHATIGAQILQKASQMVKGVSYLSLGSQISGGHHEHYDGNGYPQRLKGEDIPLPARIVAVVDVFDALLSKRPYKEPWSLKDTMEYIKGRSGTQFDPHVVEALARLVENQRLPHGAVHPTILLG
jgi:putative nucleotidyltransferase with HDIG domain